MYGGEHQAENGTDEDTGVTGRAGEPRRAERGVAQLTGVPCGDNNNNNNNNNNC